MIILFFLTLFSNAHKSLRVKMTVKMTISLLILIPFQEFVIIKINDLLLFSLEFVKKAKKTSPPVRNIQLSNEELFHVTFALKYNQWSRTQIFYFLIVD